MIRLLFTITQPRTCVLFVHNIVNLHMACLPRNLRTENPNYPRDHPADSRATTTSQAHFHEDTSFDSMREQTSSSRCTHSHQYSLFAQGSDAKKGRSLTSGSKLMRGIKTAYATLGARQERTTGEAVLVETSMVELVLRARYGIGREKDSAITVRESEARRTRVGGERVAD